MKVQNGDIVYGAKGRPGVVLDREPLSGKLVVENQGQEYQKSRKYGFINGLTPDDRQQFFNILDKVRAHEDPQARVAEITRQVEALEEDPRNFRLVRYLVAEKAHIMYSEGVSPRVYKLDESKA